MKKLLFIMVFACLYGCNTEDFTSQIKEESKKMTTEDNSH